MNIGSGTAWAILGAVGTVIMLIGFLGFIDVISTGEPIAIVLFGLGVILIVQSTIYAYLERCKIAKEIEVYERTVAARKMVASVPNDLDEGYVIDLTAEPDVIVEYGDRPRDENIEVSSEYENSSCIVSSVDHEDEYASEEPCTMLREVEIAPEDVERLPSYDYAPIERLPSRRETDSYEEEKNSDDDGVIERLPPYDRKTEPAEEDYYYED